MGFTISRQTATLTVDLNTTKSPLRKMRLTLTATSFIASRLSFLQNGLSEVDYSWAGRGEPGCVRSGGGGPVVDDADDLIDGERDDASWHLTLSASRTREIW